MTTAVYGGSFDPPHVAHVLAAHYVLSVGYADKVIVVPVFRHALSKYLAPYDLRVEMCERAFSSDSRISVSRIESELPEPSYTFHTLLALKKVFPNEELRLVIGADVVAETEHWHRFDDVCELAPPIVLGRRGFESVTEEPVVLPDISSTDARTWWREPATEVARRRREKLIPAAVRQVILRAGLYGALA